LAREWVEQFTPPIKMNGSMGHV